MKDQIGQLPGTSRHQSDNAAEPNRTTLGRPGHITALIFMLFIASCGTTDRIITDRQVTVEQKDVAVPVPGHVQTFPFSAADLPQDAGDYLTFEDDHVRLTVSRPDSPGQSEASSNEPQDGRQFFLDDYLLNVEVFPDTIEIAVPETTIVERSETVRTETRTGRFAWMVIGGLIAVVIVLLVAFRIRV